MWPNKPLSVEPVSEAGLSPSPRPVFPQFVTIGARDQDWKIFVTNGLIQTTMDHIIKSSEDVGEVVFGQPEEKAGATGPDGSGLNRRREDDWLEDTEPYHGARPRTIEVD